MPSPSYDDMITVTLRAGQWLVLSLAATEYDHRIPRDQGDGGAALDEIARQLDAAGFGRKQRP